MKRDLLAIILSHVRGGNTYTTKRLIQEAKRTRFRTAVVDPRRCVMRLSSSGLPFIRLPRRIRAKDVDVVIPRLGAGITPYDIKVMEHFAMRGVPVLNSAEACECCQDKFSTLQRLANHKIPVPKTIMSHKLIKSTSKMLSRVGGLPVILKLLKGSHGIGVILCNNAKSVNSTLETLWKLGQDILMQEYVKNNGDIRVLVVGDKVLGAVRRKAKAGEFRSNLYRGGTVRPYRMTKMLRELSLSVMRVMGLDVGGLDILPKKGYYPVFEVNASPGWEGFERAYEINVAKEILGLALEKVEGV